MLIDENKLREWNVVDYGFTNDDIPLSLDHYNQWVDKNQHLPLTYLEGDRQQKRQSLKEFWSQFKSAGVFLFSYHHSHFNLNHIYKNDTDWNGLKIASYTLGFKGDDYHDDLKLKLDQIAAECAAAHPGLQYKIVLDTHPVLERDLAYKAGLGWFGKNSMMINRDHGSFFIIGTILFDKEFKTEKEIETDHCGQCTRCAEACPTDAIDVETRTIKAADCISTFTIEQFKSDSVPGEKITLDDGQIFGCDICQDVCPWNKRVDRKLINVAPFHEPREIEILDYFIKQKPQELREQLNLMSEGAFRRKFKGTSFERSGRRGLLKNIDFFFKKKR